jgi:monoamine oxidase
VPPEAPWTAPDAEHLDREPLSAWLDRTTHTDFARFCITFMARIGGSGASELDQVSVLHMAFTQAAGPQREEPETDLFYGAAGQIPQLLAREIGEDSIKLSSPVWAIEQGDAGVVVRTSGGEYRARYVVVAIPPTLTGGIVYDPPLPRQRLQLVQRMPMGSLIREYAIYPNAFWREDGLSGIAITDLPTTPFTADSSPPSGEPGILTTYIAGNAADALERRSADERREAVLADFVKCFGPQAGKPTDFIEMNWPAETWTRGAFTAYMPPGAWTAYGEALREPVGRIHWAGAETASRWNGYFDGGVLSGEDAAAAILDQL